MYLCILDKLHTIEGLTNVLGHKYEGNVAFSLSCFRHFLHALSVCLAESGYLTLCIGSYMVFLNIRINTIIKGNGRIVFTGKIVCTKYGALSNCLH